MNKLIDKKIVMCGNHVGGKGIIEYLLKNGIQFDCFLDYRFYHKFKTFAS